MLIYKSESCVKREVKKILTEYHCFWWMPPGSAFGKSNVDFNALYQGIFLAIETKFRNNTPTPLQKNFLNSVNKESGFGFWFNEDGIECFRAFMDALDMEDTTAMMTIGVQLRKGLGKNDFTQRE